MAYLVWRNLTVTLSSGRGSQSRGTLLSEISGSVGPNDLLALMGPSGCGKTTLLDVLAGRTSSNLSRKGSIKLNGRESNLSYGVAAYVKQEDLLIGTLTVRETLMFIARLRLPAVTNGITREKRVEEVITELGLRDAANVVVGNWFLKGISNGQKRRLSIGCELLTSPMLLFLDEPTSGLDAASAYFVMKGIRELAEKGRTVISVIHQPSSEVFELFDKLCLLSGGKTIYFGDAIRAIDLFAQAGLPCPDHRNPADHFLQSTNTDFDLMENEMFDSVDSQIIALSAAFERSKYKADMEANCALLSGQSEPYKGPSARSHYFHRVSVLTWRMLLDYLRNIGVFWMRVAMYIAMCTCVGTVFFNLGHTWIDVQSRTGTLFFVTAFLTFMAIASFPAYIEELQVHSKEVLNGYYPTSAYMIASTVASTPFLFVISLASCACAYFLARLNDDAGAFVYIVLILFVSLMVTEAVMLSIAVIVPNYLMGIAGASGFMGIFCLVCGFFQAPDKLPDVVWKYPLYYMSYHTYTFRGLMNNEFHGTDGTEVLEFYKIDVHSKWIDLGILVWMLVFYRLLFLLLLISKEQRQKSR